MSFVILVLVALLQASREASSARRASSVWWPVLDIGLGFGPGGPEGLEGPFQPLGWMLVFCVRIEVVNSVS